MQNKINSHSEEYLNDSRFGWYNSDFIELMSKRWNLSNYNKLLDIGSGLCHWSKIIAPYLARPSSIVAIDNDLKWSRGTKEIIEYFKNHNIEIEFSRSDAVELPFKNNVFDVVTCQTLLIHVTNPFQVIREMYRVLKPGGIIICAEPNNVVNSLTFDSITKCLPLKDKLKLAKFELLYDEGKRELGLGDSSISEIIPLLLRNAGFKKINAYISDKVDLDISNRNIFETNADINTIETEKSLKYLKKVDIKHASFHRSYWELQNQITKIRQKEISGNSYVSCKGYLMYLISSIKEK